MASIVAQNVLSEIRKIALARIPVRERRAVAVKRIDQFKIDLVAPNVEPAVAERQKESLQRTLQRSASHHRLTAAESSVYAKALDALIGKAL
jgi:hypothetical protein